MNRQLTKPQSFQFDILDLDWKKLKTQLDSSDPKDGSFYMIVFNKGKRGEYRSKFLTYQEASDLVGLVLEKIRVRIAV